LKKRKVILNDIKWIEALWRLIKLVTDEANIVILSTMKSFEKHVCRKMTLSFFKNSQSYIVNLEGKWRSLIAKCRSSGKQITFK